MNSMQHGSLGLFPSLYCDDCFYDILARYFEHSGHMTSRATSIELFHSTPDLRASVVLPYRANLVYDWFGADSNISMETLRDYHSAWQYLQLSFYVSENDLSPIIRADIKPGRRRQSKMISMLQRNLSHLRYCPICMVIDNLKMGEPFWHQSHQLYGVKYCPYHGVPLVDSHISLSRRIKCYVSATSVFSSSSEYDMIEFGRESKNHINDPYYDSYMSLAKIICWLLGNASSLGNHDQIIQLYATGIGKSVPEIPSGQECLDYLYQAWPEGFLKDVFLEEHVLNELECGGLQTLPPLGHALLIGALSMNHALNIDYKT